MSMSMFELFWTIELILVSLDAAGFHVFTNSLMGTTIQDSGKRERSNVINKSSLSLPCNNYQFLLKVST